MRKIFFMLPFALMALGSCQKEQVTVHFHNPTDKQVISAAEAAALNIDIDFESEDGLHDIGVLLYPSGKVDDLIIDYSDHIHETSYVFEQEVDLSSYASGTEFTLVVAVCADHDCTEQTSHNISFSLE